MNNKNNDDCLERSASRYQIEIYKWSLKLNQSANKKSRQSSQKSNAAVWLPNKLPDWPRIPPGEKKESLQRIRRVSSTSQKLVFDLSDSCKLSVFPPVVSFLNDLMIIKDNIFLLLNGRNSSLSELALTLLKSAFVQ